MHNHDTLRPIGNAPGGPAAPAVTTHILSRTGLPAPIRPIALVARFFVPALAAAAAWASPSIGVLFAGLLAVWISWAVPAAIARLPIGGPKGLRDIGFGERIWLNSLHALPNDASLRTIGGLYIVQWIGLAAAVIGGLSASVWITAAALVIAYAGQIANALFLARLYATRRNTHALYRFWELSPSNDNRRKSRSRAAG